MPPSVQDVRLRGGWVPVAYHLELVVSDSLESSTNPTSFRAKQEVLLHPRIAPTGAHEDLTVSIHAGPSIDIHSVEGAQVTDRSVADETLALELPAEATGKPKWTVTILYVGSFQPDMRGLYISTFSTVTVGEASAGEEQQVVQSQQQQRKLLTTHCEPSGARHWYPCLDEPAARCDFTLALFVPFTMPEFADWEAFSGAPLATASSEGVPPPAWLFGVASGAAFRSWHFATLPKVPPYLTALFAGPVVVLHHDDADLPGGPLDSPTPLRVIAAKGRSKALLRFTLEVSAKSLRFFERLFGVPYPLPKLDLAMVPDFPIGGQENWGLILLIERCMKDQATMSANELQSLASLVAHEVSHNWFGNLVGIDWWESLWLKEGFATYCGDLAAEVFFPEATRVLGSTRLQALKTDGFVGTHPVEVPIDHPSMITQVFDDVSYSKGCALVAMCANRLGLDGTGPRGVDGSKFNHALSEYVREHQFGNTTTSQLWTALESAGNVELASLMNDFVRQPGHPTITVRRVTGEDPRRLEANQQLYRHFGVKDIADGHPSWTCSVPIATLTPDGSIRSVEGSPLVLPSKATQPAQLTLPTSSGPLVVNLPASAFCRVRYAEWSDYEALVSQVYGTLASEDRLALVDDVFALYDSGHYGPKHLTALADALMASEERSADVLPRYRRGVLGVVRPLLLPAATKESYTTDREVLAARAVAWRLGGPVLRAAVDYFPYPSLRKADVGAANQSDAGQQLSLSEKALRSGMWDGAVQLVELAEWLDLTVLKRCDCNTPDEDQQDGNALTALPEAPAAGVRHSEQLQAVRAWYDAVRRVVLSSTEIPAAQLIGELQGVALRFGALSVTMSSWEAYVKHSENPESRQHLVAIACHTRFRSELHALLRRTLTADGIRALHGHILVASAASNLSCLPRLLWGALATYWDDVVRLWGTGQFRIQHIVENVGATVLLEGDAVAYRTLLLEQKPCANARLAAERGAEQATFSVALAKHFAAEWQAVVA